MLSNNDKQIINYLEANYLTVPKHNPRSLSLISQTLSNVPSEIIIKTHIKYGTKWSAYKAILAEYAKKSSIHGIRYIFGIHRPLYERLFWLVFLIMSLYFAITFIWSIYIKWLKSPVLIGFDETLVPVYKIPFPTITICPETKMDTSIFDFNNISQQIWWEIAEYNKFENLNNLTDKNLQYFMAALQICENEVLNRFASHIAKDVKQEVAQSLLEMAINDTILFAKWNSRSYLGSDLFKYVITDEGVCYQFNGLQAADIYRDPNYITCKDVKNIDLNNYMDDTLPKFNEISGSWSLDNGYTDQGINAYPQRSYSSSTRKALYLVMFSWKEHFDRTCRNSKQGYKVFLNSPESVPLTTGNYMLVPYDKEFLVSIIPQYITTANNLHNISPEKRQCYFNDERYLRFFKTYTQNNCQTECLVNYTISKCGCAKFWMPKSSNTPVCSTADVNCYSQAADDLNLIIANQTKQKQIDPKVKIMCDCMPSCNSLDYEFEISQAFFDFEKTLMAHREPHAYKGARGSRFSIYFKENQFTAIKRTEIFGITTLIANCGGIFGLFMGISSLSIIEFLYFLTLRLFNNLRKRHYIEKKLMELDLDQQINNVYY